MTFLQKISAAASLVFRGSVPASWFAAPGLGYSQAAESMREPMRQSAWLLRGIKMISGPIANLPLEFSPQRTGGDAVELPPELQDYWAAPATGLGWDDVVEATVGWLKLEGEAFWILDDTALVPFPEARTKLAPFLVARPDRMVLAKSGNQLAGWSYTDANGRSRPLLPEQVVQIKFWNPYNEDRGLPEFDGCEVAANADYMAGVYNLRLQQNNGDQGVYVVAKNGMPTDEQRDMIVRQLREKRARQQAGEFRPVFLTGDITIEDPKVRVPDASALTARLQNREEIAVALGIPPSMFQVQASYSIGSASDRFRLREDTCIPLSRKIAGAIDQVNRRLTGKPLYSSFNWCADSVIQQVQAERADVAQKFWSMGMPLATVSDYLNLGLPEFEGSEQGYLPFSVAPVGAEPVEQQFSETPPPAEEAEEEDEESPEDEAEDAIEAAKLALRGARASTPALDEEPCECQCVVKSGANPEWATHMAKRREVVRLYESKLGRVLQQARIETLRNIEAAGVSASLRGRSAADATQRELTPPTKTAPPPSQRMPRNEALTPTQRAAASDFLFDFATFRDGLLQQMRSAATQALQIAGEQLWTEIGRSDPFKYPDPETLRFLAQRQNKIAGAADEIFKSVQSTLQDGITDGDTMSELADRVRGKFNEIDKGRAKRIAMTETASAYGQSRDVAMRLAGVTRKAWLTSGLGNVRPFHRQAGIDYSRDNAIPMRDSFRVGGEWLAHPGDPNGRADNVINCHCVQIAVAAEPIETEGVSATQDVRSAAQHSLRELTPEPTPSQSGPPIQQDVRSAAQHSLRELTPERTPLSTRGPLQQDVRSAAQHSLRELTPERTPSHD